MGMLIGLGRTAVNCEADMIGKLRPQIMVAIVLLGALSGYALYAGVESLAVGGLTGIVALAKDIIGGDAA